MRDRRPCRIKKFQHPHQASRIQQVRRLAKMFASQQRERTPGEGLCLEDLRAVLVRVQVVDVSKEISRPGEPQQNPVAVADWTVHLHETVQDIEQNVRWGPLRKYQSVLGIR